MRPTENKGEKKNRKRSLCRQILEANQQLFPLCSLVFPLFIVCCLAWPSPETTVSF